MKKITREYLLSIGFKDLQESQFRDMDLRYHVKKGLCLFTNEQEYVSAYLVGFAEMRGARVHLVTLKWIDDQEVLQKYIDLLT